MDARRARWAGGLGALAVGALALAGWLAVGHGPRGDGRHHPNVLVVLWDTVRADHLSLYGYGKPTTPRLDAFAAGAAVYERAYSPGMWTVPSHGSLFTGLPTASHGAAVGWLWLDDHHVTLAEHLRDRGYATYAWSSNPYLSDHTNLLQGFDTVKYAWRGPEAARCAEATRSKLLPGDRSTEISPGWVPSGHGKGWPEHLVAYKDGGPVIAGSFLDWVDQDRGGAPFFAYLNLLEAHHPRIPSKEAREAVADAGTVATALATDASLFRIMAAMEGRASFSADELAAIRATYDATLWDLDRATAAILDGLAARGLLDDTIVVVLSDHGENLGDNGMFDHRWDLHQSLVHVPLVARYPAKIAAGRVPTVVSTGDLFGSVLDWADLPRPAVDHALPRFGTESDVFSELEAPTPRLPEIRAAFPDLARNRWQARYQAIFRGDFKAWRASDGRFGLVNLRDDPAEQRELAGLDPATAANLREALAAWDRARPKYDPTLRIASDHPGNPLRAEPEQGAGDVSAQLRALGYAEGDGDDGDAP